MTGNKKTIDEKLEKLAGELNQLEADAKSKYNIDLAVKEPVGFYVNVLTEYLHKKGVIDKKQVDLEHLLGVKDMYVESHKALAKHKEELRTAALKKQITPATPQDVRNISHLKNDGGNN